MSSRSRILIPAVLLLLLALLLLLFLGRCTPQVAPAAAKSAPAAPSATPERNEPPAAVGAAPVREELLTAATVRGPDSVPAGARFQVEWTGPNNPGDFIAVAKPEAEAARYEHYQDTKAEPVIELLAPQEPGTWEVRYVTARTRTVLARVPLRVSPVAADVTAPPEVVAGSAFSVTWRGPNNPGDYVTVVPKGAPDSQYNSYVNTAKGTAVELTAPIEPGEAEVRYVTGGRAQVLARRPVRVTAAAVTIQAPSSAVAGSLVAITWTGPGNKGDYLTVVPVALRDGQYGNYTDTAKGSPLHVTAPIEPGAAEIRYMSGQGARVLARRELQITAPTIQLSAPGQAAAGSTVSVTWTGPDHPGDYLTIVAQGAKDGAMFRMTATTRGSPAKVDAPPQPGPAEIRYMSGQGNRVLGRTSIELR